MSTTRKKIRVLGKQDFINRDTGEIQEMQVIEIAEKDANFHKIWLGHILESIDIIGNQKVKLVFWMLKNMNKDNQLIMTQRKIGEETNMSTKTINETLKILIDSNFLKKIHSGVYQINPNVIWKGGKNERMNVLIKYHNDDKTEIK